MKFEYQDDIDNYLRGRMSAEERKAFEQEMAEDDELKEQVEFTANVQRATRSRKEKLDAMREWENESDNEKPAGRINLYWISGIAALLVVGFFMFSKTFIYTKEGVIDDMSDNNAKIGYGKNVGHDDMIRSDLGSIEGFEYNSTMSDNEVEALLNKIVDKEQKLKEKYQQIQADSNDHERYAEMEQLDGMLDNLRWNKALSLRHLHRKGEALKLFDKIRNESITYMFEADSIYKQMLKEL